MQMTHESIDKALEKVDLENWYYPRDYFKYYYLGVVILSQPSIVSFFDLFDMFFPAAEGQVEITR